MNKLISIRNAIIDAMELCGADHDKDLPVFTRWATLAEKNIGSYFQYVKKIAVLEVKNCIACLPEDAAYIQRAILGDHGCDCTDLFARFCSKRYGSGPYATTSPDVNSFMIVDIGSGIHDGYTLINHTVQDNKLIFEHNYDGQKVTIQYLAYQTDCDGFLMISENHVEAITFNILWKYYLRKKRPSNEDFYKIREYKTDWFRELRNSRAKDAELTETDRLKIVEMIHDPYIGYGLAVGMHPTGSNLLF